MEDGRSEHQGLPEDYTRRVFERYESAAKTFGRLLGGLVGFAAGFFLIVLMPYVGIQRTNHAIKEHLASLTAAMDQRRQLTAGYRQLQGGIQALERRIQASPEELRAFIHDLELHGQALASAPLPPSPMPQESIPLPPVAQMGPIGPQRAVGPPAPVQHPLLLPGPSAPAGAIPEFLSPSMLGPCASFSGTEQLHCLVRQKVLAQFDEYGRILQQDITRPLRSLAGQSPAVDVETMAEGLERLRGTFVRKLEENPRFWRTVTGKLGFAVELREEVDRFWKAYGAVVEEQRTRLEHELTGLEEARAVLEKRQAELAAQEQEIAARLKHMETPVWKLPVGLNEAVLLFPLIVAVGFWLCVQHLREGLRLRRIVHGLYVAQDPARRRLTGDQVRVMAPLWIDPADLEQNRAARVAVLAIPPVVFLLACLSVFYLWTLPGSLKGFGLFERYVYGVLYATSLVVLVYGVWVTRAEIQAYSINESAEGP